MASSIARPDCARVLGWNLHDGGLVKVELHQVSVEEWRETPRYQDEMWHVVPPRGGYVILARLSYRPA